MNVHVNACLFLCVSPGIEWQPELANSELAAETWTENCVWISEEGTRRVACGAVRMPFNFNGDNFICQV